MQRVKAPACFTSISNRVQVQAKTNQFSIQMPANAAGKAVDDDSVLGGLVTNMGDQPGPDPVSAAI